jgi:hypothetical protein
VIRRTLTPAEEKWLARHESELPHEGDGRDSAHVEPYAFFAAEHDSTGNDDATGWWSAGFDRETPLDRREVSDVRDAEKSAYYTGMESTLDRESVETFPASAITSGTLKSTWPRVERTLSAFFQRGGKRRQHRGSRKNYKKHTVWEWRLTPKSERGEMFCPHRRVDVPVPLLKLVEVPKSFRPEYHTTARAWDASSQDFREVTYIRGNPLDSTGWLEHQRKVYDSKSPRRSEAVLDLNEMHVAAPIRHHVGVMREWSGKKTDEVYLRWLASGDYDALLAYHAAIAQSR